MTIAHLLPVPAPTASLDAPTSIAPTAHLGSAQGGPRLVLRIEAAVVFVAGLAAYAWQGGSWSWFALLFLLPDLSMLGYLGGPRLGAGLYNAAHSYVAPAALAALALAGHAQFPLLGAIIWIAHIGLDRLLGYGLKYSTAFGDTHLGRIGRAHAQRRRA